MLCRTSTEQELPLHMCYMCAWSKECCTFGSSASYLAPRWRIKPLSISFLTLFNRLTHACVHMFRCIWFSLCRYIYMHFRGTDIHHIYNRWIDIHLHYVYTVGVLYMWVFFKMCNTKWYLAAWCSRNKLWTQSWHIISFLVDMATCL